MSSNRLTLLTVDNDTEILGGEDSDSMSQGAGAELSDDSTISVYLPVCQEHRRHYFDAAICAHVGSEDVPTQLHREATHGQFNSSDTFVLRLKPEVFWEDIAHGQFHGQ